MSHDERKNAWLHYRRCTFTTVHRALPLGMQHCVEDIIQLIECYKVNAGSSSACCWCGWLADVCTGWWELFYNTVVIGQHAWWLPCIFCIFCKNSRGDSFLLLLLLQQKSEVFYCVKHPARAMLHPARFAACFLEFWSGSLTQRLHLLLNNSSSAQRSPACHSLGVQHGLDVQLSAISWNAGSSACCWSGWVVSDKLCALVGGSCFTLQWCWVKTSLGLPLGGFLQ